jgi:Mrp family chromosome partitioning ATPase
MRPPKARKPCKSPKGAKLGKETEAERAPKAKRNDPAPDVAWLAPSGYRFSQRRMPMVCSELGVPSFIDLATMIAAGHLARGRRGLAVCGAAAEAGVSFLAANLAAALAHGGTPTRLVEANLRTPGLVHAITPPDAEHGSGRGLSDLLLDETVRLADILNPDVMPDLSVVYAGERYAQAADLLTTERFRQFVQACLRDTGCTIFDTAPANRSVDARVVAREAGYALIVARRGKSFYDDVEMLTAQLTQDGVVIVGTVLNRG